MYRTVACLAACFELRTAAARFHTGKCTSASRLRKAQNALHKTRQLMEVQTASCDVQHGKKPTCVDGLASSLEQQQLVKGLKDVDGRLVDGAHNGAASVDNIAHSPHHNGSCPCIQPCIRKDKGQPCFA